MAKQFGSCIHSSRYKINGIQSVFRYSTESSSPVEDTLYSRIIPSVSPRASVCPVLDQLVTHGPPPKQPQLQKIIRQLRKYRRFNHALEVSQWMSDKRYLNLSPGDVAVRLDLISKVHGLEQAEKYFNNLSDIYKVVQVYGALLNCYAQAKSTVKAEATMEKMRNSGFIRTLSYNVMLKMYSELENHEKLDSLMAEMIEKGVPCDKYTYNIRLNAYATASDIKGMEKLLLKMVADRSLVIDWNAYVIAANGYLKAGATEKAVTMLKKSEKRITVKTRSGYEVLISLYASAGNKHDVYRLWDLYKKSGKAYNTCYISIISSLVKLDDLEGAEKILVEWEADTQISFDIRIPNILISAYCKKGCLGEAESIANRITESGNELNASTWDRLAFGYYKDNQMEKAVETMKKAILVGHPKWRPNYSTLVACMDYLKSKGDVDVAEEFINLVKTWGHLSIKSCDKLVDDINNGSAIELFDQMGDDEHEQEVV